MDSSVPEASTLIPLLIPRAWTYKLPYIFGEGEKNNNIILPSRQKSSVPAKPPYGYLKSDFASNIAGLIYFPVTHS